MQIVHKLCSCNYLLNYFVLLCILNLNQQLYVSPYTKKARSPMDHFCV